MSAKPNTDDAQPLQTRFYVVAEIVCTVCNGTCRVKRQSREGEPDYCSGCEGQGVTGKRINLRDALKELGVILPTSTENER